MRTQNSLSHTPTKNIPPVAPTIVTQEEWCQLDLLWDEDIVAFIQEKLRGKAVLVMDRGLGHAVQEWGDQESPQEFYLAFDSHGVSFHMSTQAFHWINAVQ
jgi:hypothetical protein